MTEVLAVDQSREMPLLATLMIGAVSGLVSVEVVEMFQLSGLCYIGAVGVLIFLTTQFGLRSMRQFWE